VGRRLYFRKIQQLASATSIRLPRRIIRKDMMGKIINENYSY
jgi:hypothetical protein